MLRGDRSVHIHVDSEIGELIAAPHYLLSAAYSLVVYRLYLSSRQSFFGVTATAVELCTDGKLRTVGLPIPSSVTSRLLLFELMQVLTIYREYQ